MVAMATYDYTEKKQKLENRNRKKNNCTNSSSDKMVKSRPGHG